LGDTTFGVWMAPHQLAHQPEPSHPRDPGKFHGLFWGGMTDCCAYCNLLKIIAPAYCWMWHMHLGIMPQMKKLSRPATPPWHICVIPKESRKIRLFLLRWAS
jgi:hypothetical protein